MERTEFLQLFRDCLQDGSIHISCSIEPQRAKCGSGEWNSSMVNIEIHLTESEHFYFGFPGSVDLVRTDRYSDSY